MNRLHAILAIVLFPLLANAGQYTVTPAILNVSVGSVTPITYSGAPGPYPTYSNATNGNVINDGGVFKYVAPSAPVNAEIYLFRNSTDYALLTVNVYPKITVADKLPFYVTAGTGFTISPTGGKPPYNFYLKSGSIGTIDALTGRYDAPKATGNAVIQVTDGSRQSVEFPVVIPDLMLSPGSLRVLTGSSTTFAIDGGLPPYTIKANAGSIVKNGSGQSYTAPLSQVDDVITVTDALNVSRQIQVMVSTPLKADNPVYIRADTSATIVSGGRAPYTFVKTSGIGTVDVNGRYYAPHATGTAVVNVKDYSGQNLDVNISIPKMSISPGEVTVNAGSTNTFTVNGGVRDLVATKKYGGSLSVSGGVITYVAPNSAYTDEVIKITDQENNSINLKVTVIAPNPTIASFSVDRSLIIPGETVRLSWSVGNVTSLKLNPGNIDVTGKTYYETSPWAPTTWTLTAVSGLTSVSASTSITMGPKLDGTFIASKYSSGCAPQEYDDYMDKMAWTNRRVAPRDCEVVNISTPVFRWVLPMDKSSNSATEQMTLTINKLTTNGSVESTTTYKTSSPWYISPALPDGKYQWNVQYLNASGDKIITSANRRFEIRRSKSVTIPLSSSILSAVKAKTHPRAIQKPFDRNTFYSRVMGTDYKSSYPVFLSDADKYSQQTINGGGIPSVPADKTIADFGGDPNAFQTYELSLMKLTAAERTAIETLGYAYHFTGNTTYLNKGIERAKLLAQWPVNGNTSEARQDQANREIYLAMAIGLDLFYDKLSTDSSSRMLLVNTLKNRLNQAMVGYLKLTPTQGFPVNLERNPYDSHLLTAVQYITEGLMYVAGHPDFPEADDLLKRTWDAMIASTGSWGGYDGAYGNGSGYGWVAMTSTARTLAAVKLLSDYDLSAWDPFGNIGYNQFAFQAPLMEVRGQFGDDLETTEQYTGYTHDSFRLLALMTGNPHYEWYWRFFEWNTRAQVALNPHHYLLLGLKNPLGPQSTPSLVQDMVFEDAGFVAFHTDTTDQYRSSVFFRSSRLGTENHSHGDNNGFTFVSKGKEILISGGYYGSFGSDHHVRVGRTTRHKNALTFDDGIGQAHMLTNDEPVLKAGNLTAFSGEFRGKLVNYSANSLWSIVTGDATKAYRSYKKETGVFTPLLTDAVRTVAYNRSAGVIVVYDYATSSQVARKWELNFNSLTNPAKTDNNHFKISNGSFACIDVYAPAGVLTTTNTFLYPAPAGRPVQYKSTYKVNSATNQFVAITIIREDCRTDKVITVDFASNSALTLVTVGSKPISFNGRTVNYRD